MRFLLLADSHIKNDSEAEPTPRLLWGLQALRKVHEYAKANGITIIKHAGDFWDSAKPQALAFSRVTSLFWEFHEDSPDIRWYFLRGNHDITSARAGSSYLDILVESLPNAGFLSGKPEGGLYQMEHILFNAVPYSTHAQMEHEAKSRILGSSKSKLKVLITHATFQGVRQGTWRAVTGMKYGKGSGMNYDLILTGHFHSHQFLGRSVVYPGALYPFDFTQDQRTGFLDVVLNTDQTYSIKHIAIHEPRHHVIFRKAGKITDIVQDGKEPVDGAYLKVVVTGKPEELAAIRSLREDIGAELKAMGALDVRWNLEPVVMEEARIQFNHETSLPELIQQYVDGADTPLDKAKLSRMGVEYLS